MGTKKKWFSSAFSEDVDVTISPKKAKTVLRSFSKSIVKRSSQHENDNDSDCMIVQPNTGSNSENFLDKLTPKTVTELAIHPKKIEEIQNWFKQCDAVRKDTQSPMLLISGPAGCGKTTTVKVLAKHLRYEIVEWVTPVDIDLTYDIKNNFSTQEDRTYKESQLDMFRRFLFRSSRYKSVFDTLDRRIVIVEDFPTIFFREPDTFADIIEEYKNYGKSPLVFIATDSKNKDANLTYSLFSDSIKSRFNITQIVFNAVSKTLLQKALSRVSSIMQKDSFNKNDNVNNLYKVPSQDVMENVNIASQGDIRNAVINLYFLSQKGAPKLQTFAPKNTTSSRKNKSKLKKLKDMGCDESITFMHALGRVFNPKYIEESNPKKFVHCPEDITDSYSSEPKNFVNLTFANFLPHYRDIEHVVEAIDNISWCDLLMNDYRDDSLPILGLNICIRGLMVHNVSPVTGWRPIRGLWKDTNKVDLAAELKYFGLASNTTKSIWAKDYRTFLNIIKSTENN